MRVRILNHTSQQSMSMLSQGVDIALSRFHLGPYNKDDRLIGTLSATFAASVCLANGLDFEIETARPIDPGLADFLTSFCSKTKTKPFKFVGPFENYPQPEFDHTKGIASCLSGGLDSTSAVYRFLELGYDVVGMFANTGQVPLNGGVWNETASVEEFERIAEALPGKFSLVKSVCRITKFPTEERIWLKALRNPLLILTASTYSPSRVVSLSCNSEDQIFDSNEYVVTTLGHYAGLKVLTPNVGLRPVDEIAYLVSLGRKLDRPVYESTYSCQFGKRLGPGYFCCGSCHSCLQRTQGVLAGVDPYISGRYPVHPSVNKLSNYYKYNWMKSNRIFEHVGKLSEVQQLPYMASIHRLSELRLAPLPLIGFLNLYNDRQSATTCSDWYSSGHFYITKDPVVSTAVESSDLVL